MGLLQKAENLQAFGKIGFLGFAKSGKTYTSSMMAIGLHKLIKSKKPIAFLDTETGSDYVIPLFKKEGIELIAAKTRAFEDLLKITQEASESCDILVVDSVSHIWTDVIESYLKKKGKKSLAFQDWNVIKPTWREFTDLYLISKLHIIICGRAQFEWDYFENEEGKMELYKTGTKMRAETEFGFEPSLLIEMERIKDSGKLIHRAKIIGDRAQLLDGQEFDNPTFDNFLPHFQALNLGGEHNPLDVTRNSQDMFEHETGRPEWKAKQTKKDIALEEIQGSMVKLWPGATKEEKASKGDFIDVVFGTRSWTAVSEQPLEILENVKHRLRKFEGFYSEMTEPDISMAWDATSQQDDDIPDFTPPESQDGGQATTSPDDAGESTPKYNIPDKIPWTGKATMIVMLKELQEKEPIYFQSQTIPHEIDLDKLNALGSLNEEQAWNFYKDVLKAANEGGEFA